MTPLVQLHIAAITFVGTHFLLSHTLRSPLIRLLGQKAFLGVYSLIAFATLGWLGWSAAQMPPEPVRWEPGTAGWIAATLLVWVGAILFAGSHKGNPALPHPDGAMKPIGEPWGVFRITRHPMMWGFALWAVGHAIVNATTSGLVISGAIGILALLGSALQDRKKQRLYGPVWKEWTAKTGFFPFARGWAYPGTMAVAAGTALFVVASWAHGALGYRPAGFWAF